MSRSIITGIDIGTHQVKVVISSAKEQKILAVGSAETRGLRHGYVVNISDVVSSIREAVNDAEKKIDAKVKKAFISVGGIGLGSVTSSSSIAISRADLEITSLDIKR